MQAILNNIHISTTLWNVYLYDITKILKIARITETEFDSIQKKMTVRFDCNLIIEPVDIYNSFKIACLLLRPVQYWEYLEHAGIF